MLEVTFNGPSHQVANGYAHSTPNLVRFMREQGIELIQDGAPRKLGLGYGYPRMAAALKTEVRLCFTMFESDMMPLSWGADLAFVNAVIVPSPFCADTYRRTFGDRMELFTVPLGIEPDEWPLLERPKRDAFTFLSYESLNVRKGFFELFGAFTEAFGDDPTTRLLLKTARTEHVLPLGQYKNVEVRKGAYTREQMLGLLSEADAFVFPSRGEGFGHTPLEALSTGLPVIVPDAHGISTYFDPKYFHGVAYGPIPARYDHIRGEDVGNYVRVDKDSLIRAMRLVRANHGHPSAPKRAREAHDWVDANWTYRVKTAPLLAEILRKYATL